MPIMTVAYAFCLLISGFLFIYLAHKSYNNIDAHYWTIVILIPIIVLGYCLKTTVTEVESVAYLFCFIYLDSTFLIVLVLFSMLQNLGIKVRGWMKVIAYGLSSVHIAILAICTHNDLYYKTITIEKTSIGNATKMESGPLKIYHYIFLAVLFIWLVIMLIAGIRKSKTYSRKILNIYGSAVLIGMLTHLVEGIVSADFTILPFIYVLGEIILVCGYDYLHAHDVACVVVERNSSSDSRGYVTIGRNHEFLGCNDRAFDFLPFLKDQIKDAVIENDDDDELKNTINTLIDSYELAGKKSVRFMVNDMTCVCEIMPFSNRTGGKNIGYMLDLRDATEEQKNLDIIKSYNERLNEEVIEKTNNIKDIQRKVVLGMANMIENRDNNTGGHVKRTSDIIHIIVDEIKKQGRINITDEYARDIVRAAPTHDLGKVSIDSNILNKPARLTDDEFKIMKTHSTKSGEMVLILLDGVEEKRFVDVAFNVARFHHERWDGRGYPEGLVGSMIPLEARIMAVADVYDALVSKRCYKEPMSFEQAAKIMRESMGTQFDPNMASVFEGCREQLEQYYKNT